MNGVRLNLLAILVPDNGFTLGGIVRDRKTGTASITADLSNPGVVTLAGKGLKKRDPKNLPGGRARHLHSSPRSARRSASSCARAG